MRSILLLTTLLAMTAVIWAQEQQPTNQPATMPATQPSQAATIAPLVNEQTLMVAHVQMERRAFNALAQRVNEIQNQVQQREAGPKPQTQPAEVMMKWFDDYTQAGGRDLYLVLSDLEQGYLTVISLAPDADTAALNKIMEVQDADAASPMIGAGQVSRKMDNLLVIGSQNQLAQLRDMKPAQRSELAQAFQAAGRDAFFTAAIIPTSESLQALSQTMPKLPPQFGGESTEPLTQGLRWGMLSLKTAPQQSMDMVIQARDNESASDIHQMSQRVIAAVGRAQGEPTTRPAPAERFWMPMLKTLAQNLEPQLEGDQIRAHLDQSQIDRIVQNAVVPMVVNARQMARQMLTAMTIRNLLMSSMMYASKHQGNWPDNLEALVQEQGIPEKLLENPRDPEIKPGYIYIKPPKDAPPNTVVIHENYREWPGSLAVGFANGSVRVIESEQEFNDLKAGKAATAPATQPAPTGEL